MSATTEHWAGGQVTFHGGGGTTPSDGGWRFPLSPRELFEVQSLAAEHAERLKVLADHLNPSRRNLISFDLCSGSVVAGRILDDPQAHIDALVAAGVLHEHQINTGTKQSRRTVYNLHPKQEPPHVHDWRVVNRPSHFGQCADIQCADPSCEHGNPMGALRVPTMPGTPMPNIDQFPKFEGEVAL